MPIEIRELQITTIIQDQPDSQVNVSASPSSPADNNSIIAACVEQVLEILQQKNER